MARLQRTMALQNKQMTTRQQSKIQVKKVAFYFRILDHLLWPFMWILAKGKVERPQESHRWHFQDIECDILEKIMDPHLIVSIEGDDPSRFDINSLGLFHLPLFGGWKNYIILEANNFSRYWHVGWRIYRGGTKNLVRCQIQKLRISSSCIKLLKGVPGKRAEFFGVDDSGKQVSVRVVGEGKLGDGQFRNVRLF